MKMIYFLDSNLAGYAYFGIESAKLLGFKTKFVYSSLSDCQKMAHNPLLVADESDQIDTLDLNKLLHYFNSEKQKNHEIAGVIAFDDFRLINATIINNYLNKTIGPSLHALVTCRFKDQLRNQLKDTPYHIPYAVLDIYKKINLSDIMYPCIVKPIDGSASVGVIACQNESEFTNAIKTIQSLDKSITRDYSLSKSCLMEKYIVGNEFSAEMVWDHSHKKWQLIGITKKVLTGYPYNVEVGHIFPFYFDEQSQMRIYDSLREILAIIKLENTAVHIEFKYIDNQIYIMEINPRPCGGNLVALIQYAHHVNMIELYLKSLLHITDRFIIAHSSATYALAFLSLSEKMNIHSIEQHTQIKDILIKNIAHLPKKIHGLINNNDLLGYVITKHHDVDSAETLINSLMNYFTVTGERI